MDDWENWLKFVFTLSLKIRCRCHIVAKHVVATPRGYNCVALSLVAEALMCCRVVVVAMQKNCRVPSSALWWSYNHGYFNFISFNLCQVDKCWNSPGCSYQLTNAPHGPPGRYKNYWRLISSNGLQFFELVKSAIKVPQIAILCVYCCCVLTIGIEQQEKLFLLTRWSRPILLCSTLKLMNL